MTRRDMMLGAVALSLGASRASAMVPVGGPAFGSSWRLVSGMADPMRVTPIIARHVAAVDAAMSPYRAASDLSRFNRAPPGEIVEIPPSMAQVVAAACAMARGTGGAFDPTTGPMVHRYGFGPITGEAGSIDDIVLTGAGLRKTAPGVTLDLCGIAKGHALDLIAEDLAANGAADFLLELGGEVRAFGRHPSGRPWQVAIEDPFSPAFRARHIVAPGLLALATSGHSANGVMGEVSVSHVIDPHTACPASEFAGSVSVLAETGIEADAWATALLAIGRRGPDFARDAGLSALFILGPVERGASITTGDFAAHILA